MGKKGTLQTCQDGSSIRVQQMVNAGWESITLWEYANQSNMEGEGEAGFIRLFKDPNLPSEVWIHVQAGGGGALTLRSESEGVRFGVYMCLNITGIEPFVITTQRLVNSLQAYPRHLFFFYAKSTHHGPPCDCWFIQGACTCTLTCAALDRASLT